MTNEELIERLRSVAGVDHLPRTDLAVLAADALEASDARIAELEAGIERVRSIHRNAGPSQGYDSRFKGDYGMLGDCCETCGSHGEYGVEWPCPTVASLDGAPEPEWEWGYRGETLIDVHPRKSRESAEGAVKDLTEYWALHGKKFELVRRRKAGPWEPVEGESDGV